MRHSNAEARPERVAVELSPGPEATGAMVPARSGDLVADASAEVVTRMVFRAPIDRVWRTIMFYEQIDQRPPLHLRWLLPVPLGTEGRKTAVGDEAKCLYEGGFLVKRVVRVVAAELYAFEVIEQELAFGGGMRLSGGAYRLRSQADGSTEVALTTRYRGGWRPRWLLAPIEGVVCHMFHRHILRAMRRVAVAG